MNVYLRRFVFLLFVLSFFSSAGYISLYTLGYRYNTERGIFVYTGSVTVQSNPSTVNITVDDEQTKTNINQLNESYHIAGLKPGEHTITVSADGYSTWTKKFIVNSGISTEFWNVVLTRNDYEKKTYPIEPLTKVYPSPSSTLLAYVTSTDQGFSVNTLDIETNETARIFETQEYTFNINDKENIEWSIDADFISLPATKDGKKFYFIINNKTLEVRNLQEFSGLEDLRGVRWDSSRNMFLLALSGTTLYEINVQNQQEKQIAAENVQNYDISGNDLYIYEPAPSNIIYKTALNNLGTRTQITTIPNENTAGDFSVIAYDQNRLTLINYSTGQLYIFNKNKDQVSLVTQSNVKGAQFSDDGKKILYWTDKEMSVYFTRDWETQPVRQANVSLTIGRFSQSISNIHWASDYEHATFSVGNTIKLIELDNRGEKSILDVMKLDHEPIQIISNFDKNLLFFTETLTSQQNQTLHSIEFPEIESGIFNQRPQ